MVKVGGRPICSDQPTIRIRPLGLVRIETNRQVRMGNDNLMMTPIRMQINVCRLDPILWLGNMVEVDIRCSSIELHDEAPHHLLGKIKLAQNSACLYGEIEFKINKKVQFSSVFPSIRSSFLAELNSLVCVENKMKMMILAKLG